MPGPIGAAAAYAVAAGGKRFRPLLTMACYSIVKPNGVEALALDEALDVAAATELIHTYSLLHDDLPCMDDDDRRRGIPTTHLVYGVAVAAAAGLALQQIAFLAIAESGRESSPDLLRELARASGGEGMVGGQAMDLDAEGIELDAAGLEAIHRAKTSALIAASCALGAMSAGAEPDVVDAFRSYGTNLGLAFQIADDLLDVTGDPEQTGKPAGSDAGRSKATYPSIHGVDGATHHASLAVEAARDDLSRIPADSSLLDAFATYAISRVT